MEKWYKLCPTIYGSLAKDLWLLEELMLIFVLSFAQERNYMVLTKLLPKLFFSAISITRQNLLMFSVIIIMMMVIVVLMALMAEVVISFTEQVPF